MPEPGKPCLPCPVPPCSDPPVRDTPPATGLALPAMFCLTNRSAPNHCKRAKPAKIPSPERPCQDESRQVTPALPSRTLRGPTTLHRATSSHSLPASSRPNEPYRAHPCSDLPSLPTTLPRVLRLPPVSRLLAGRHFAATRYFGNEHATETPRERVGSSTLFATRHSA